MFYSPEFEFTLEQLRGHERKSGLITLLVGGVAVCDVLIDSGATCKVVGQQIWEMLKLRRINYESCKSARELFVYGSTEPLPTFGTFTADISLTGNNSGCRACFVCRETAEILNLLHIGPFQANNVDSGGLESCIREKYKVLFTGVGLLKEYKLKLHIDESVKPGPSLCAEYRLGYGRRWTRSSTSFWSSTL